MTTHASKLHVGEFLVEGGHIFQVIKTKVLATKHHDLHFTLHNVATDKRSTRHWCNNHPVRLIVPEKHHYTIVCITREDTLVALELMDNKTAVTRSDVLVSDPGLVTYLTTYYEKEEAGADGAEPAPLDAHLYKFVVEPLHRDENEIVVQQLVYVKGYDMTHDYDHHHGHHHTHSSETTHNARNCAFAHFPRITSMLS